MRRLSLARYCNRFFSSALISAVKSSVSVRSASYFIQRVVQCQYRQLVGVGGGCGWRGATVFTAAVTGSAAGGAVHFFGPCADVGGWHVCQR